VLHKQEKYKEAIAEFDKAIKINPNYGGAYVNRGITKEMIRDVDGGCADWKKAEKLGEKQGKKFYINNCD